MARYALVIGVGENIGNLPPLSKTVGDAEAIAQVLEKDGKFIVESRTGKVTRKDLEGAISQLLQQAQNQEALIYYTGHAFPLMKGFGKSEAFLASSDCTVTIEDGQITRQEKGLSLSDLTEVLGEASLGNLVVLLDCCHSGYLLEEKLLERTFSSFKQKDYLLITACQSFQQARAKRSEQHSVFTNAVLEGLKRENADPQTQAVTGDRLFEFVYEQLKDSGQEALRLSVGRPIELVRFRSKLDVSSTVNEANPYQGLLAFTPETKQFFFGRDIVVQQLVRLLQTSNFVPVIGPSGSGKSSVVRAGLVPRLRDLGWRVLEPMKPGAEPIYELKRSFDAVFDRRKLTEIYACIEAEGLRGIVDRLPEQKHLLVIDQFEEVFTLSPDRAKQRRFIELLMGLEGVDRLAIVTTMRSDFVEDWQAHGDLVAMLPAQTVWMPPLEGEELRSAIVCPAEVQGYSFEVGLEDLILEDVREEPNCLPLLEFALTELWRSRDQQKHWLTVAAYRGMGRLMGALDQYATEWYGGLTEQEQEQVRRVMLELVRVGMEAKDTRWRRSKEDLLGIDRSLEEVVDLLIDRRLLVSEGEEIDLAHERLMDGWQLFAEWRQKDRDLRRLAQRVKDAEQEWREKGQQDDYLIQGGLLSEVREQLEALSLSPKLKAFYQLSEQSHQEKIVFREKALTESQLREQAMRVLNLLPVRPHQAAVEAIQATGNSFNKLKNRVLPPVQSNLRDVIEKVRESHRLQGHSASVLSVAFSLDGKTIVSGSVDKTIRLWDLDGNSIGQPFQGHSDSVNSAAFSPDGKTIVSGSADHTLRLWNLDGNSIGQPFQGHSDSVNSVAFSPDGKTIVSGSADKTIRLWDLDGNSIGQSFQGYSDSVLSVAFSPDGKTIVSGSVDNNIRLWDLDGNPIGQLFQGHSASVLSVAFSPDGKTIVSGSADKTIRLWNLDGNSIGQPFQGHSASVLSVAFSSDGKTIVSGSADKTIRLWGLDGNPIDQTFHGHSASVLSVAFSPDGKTIVSGSADNIIFSADKTIRLWDLDGNSIGQPFQGHSASVLSVAFSPDGKTIVSGSGDNNIRLWDLAGNPIGQPFQGHSASVLSAAFSPDGKTIVSGSADNNIRLWDLAGNSIGQPFQGHRDWVNSVAFSPDGKTVVSGSADNIIFRGSADNIIRLWDLAGNPIGQPFQGHSASVLSVAFSPDGKTIVSGSADDIIFRSSADNNIRLWDLDGNPIGQPFQGHSASVNSVAFSPDGKTIVSGSADKTIRLWDLDGNPIGQPFQGHSASVNSVAFSPDGKTIVSGSDDETIRLWDLDGNPIGQPFQGHSASVRSVAFSPDGKTIVSGSDDGTIRLWLGGTWQDWLRICCDRFRHHPSLNDPTNPIAVEACEVCRKYVWEKEAPMANPEE